jgi:hypothetical protein
MLVFRHLSPSFAFQFWQLRRFWQFWQSFSSTFPMSQKRQTPQQTNAKRKEYVKNHMDGMTKYDAARAAGFSPSMARNAANRIETPEVRDEIQSLQKALVAGIPTGLIVEKLREGLDATIVKTAQKTGEFTDERKFPDYRIRLRYLEKITLWSGRYQPKTPAAPAGRDGGPIDLEALTDEQLEQRKQWLLQQLGFTQPGGSAVGSVPQRPDGQKAG